ncbi:MAG: type I DNA topoisomerase [Sphaerochaetaceae bacterium]|nr:type I DNA topoisomerase [Sphaerochaetaceae bacterium]
MAKAKEVTDKTLIIVESPTKARTIKKFLPSNTQVIACNGHIRDLPEKDTAVDVEDNFKPKYVISAGKEKIIKELKKELATSSRLLLATDEDREGESISWHLIEVLNPKVPYQRMVFHEITKKAITYAIDHGRELDMDLVNAQEARRILDRLYGYTLSPLLWKKLSVRNLSAGRVQSPGLRLIVDRERERLAFVKASYWDVVASVHTEANPKIPFEAKLESIDDQRIASGKDFDPNTGKLLPKKKVTVVDGDMAQMIAEKVKKSDWKVESVTEKEKKNRPAPPFITSTLQQEGSRKLRMSAKETMRVAQKLYESGLITYMRTDSPALSEEGIKGARDAAGKLFGMNFLSPSPRRYTSKNASAQEAHEAIRPAGESFVHPDDTGLHGKELALYDLIWKRTLACQMADAVKATTSVKLSVDSYRFGATGNRIVFPGFIRVYVEGKDDPEAALDDSEKILPPLSAQSVIDVKSSEAVEHETKSPARFTEATLVQELEKQGIGRPSTYATIIDKLFEKKYAEKENNALVPTFVGFAVVQLLENNFDDLVNYDFTSKMEESLDNIARGEQDEASFLKSFYDGNKGLKATVDQKMDSIDSLEAKKIKLPTISDKHGVYVGKYGPYIKTSAGDDVEVSVSIPVNIYPGTITEEQIENLVKAKAEGSDAVKPICHHPNGKPVYLLSGKYGPYFQLGEVEKGAGKPKRFSVPKGKDPSQMSCDEIIRYLDLPRVLGVDEKTGEEVRASIGKYGPYVSMNGEFRSLPDEQKLFDITLEDALALLNQPKPGQSKKGKSEPVRSFGEVDGKLLAVYNGRYGFYGKYGSENFALEDEMKKNAAKLEELTEEKMLELYKNYTPAKKTKKKRTAKKS